MTINKFNYEAFALDYLEGNLSPELVEEMELFLKTHPAIESELSGMMEFVILEADESIVYEQKESLLKPERVVWIQKRWIRPLLAAASVALLLMTYVMGYQAGVNNGIEPLMVEKEDNNKNSAKETEVVVNKIEPLVKIEPAERNEIVDNSPATTKKTSINNKKEIAPIITLPIERPSIGRAKTIVADNKTRNHPTEKVPVLTPDPMSLPPNKMDAAQMEQMMTNVLATLTTTNLMSIQVSSTTINTNDLGQILAADLPMDKEKLAQQLKRKRSFKDFLGKFPVNNLKEALIPSYYREEATGQ